MSYDLLRFSLLFRRFVTVKADDSVPPFFTESEFRTLHLFRAPPSLITKQPNRPTLRVGRPQSPEAKRAGFVSAPQICKGRSVRVFRGCGFCRSNGTLPLFLGPSAPCGRLLVTAASRGVSRGAEAVRTRLAVSASDLRLSPVALVGVPPAEATPRRRRGGGDSSRDGAGMWGPSPLGHWGLAAKSAVRGQSAEAEKSARRRRGRRQKTRPDGVGERSPAPATAAPCVVVSVTEARQWHCCGARETAQALHHGCGDDCSRSASLAALHARPLALH